jgi:two-component system sensor histidine kinase/response regulator
MVKIFDSTQHISTFGTNREVGSGLGINLCKDFTLKNGGDLWVKSEVGKGTSFFLRLPATDSEILNLN